MRQLAGIAESEQRQRDILSQPKPMKSLNFGNLLNGFLLPNCPSAWPFERALWHFRTIDLVAYPNSLPNRVNQTLKAQTLLFASSAPFGLGSKLVPWRWLHLICNANAMAVPKTRTTTTTARCSWGGLLCISSFACGRCLLYANRK